MWDYVKRHEAFVRAALEREGVPTEELRAFHEQQIRYMQHERLIHLVVTMFCATFLLLVIGFTAVRPTLAGGALAVLLLGLVSAYLVHYFRLENGVQRWYHLANRIDARLGRVSADYEARGR